MSLPTREHDDFVNGYRAVVEALGTSFVYRSNGDGTGQTITAHFVDPKADDTALINAVGLEGRIAHTLAQPTVTKYDTLTSPTGKVYTVHASHEIFVNDTIVGYKLVMS